MRELDYCYIDEKTGKHLTSYRPTKEDATRELKKTYSEEELKKYTVKLREMPSGWKPK